MQHLKTTAQRQLVPPITTEEAPQPTATSPPNTNAATAVTAHNAPNTTTPTSAPTANTLFFPLVNLYDYLHLCCLNMQLEIFYVQSAMLVKTRWINQLKVDMNQDRTKLTLTYWRGGSPVAHWARPQEQSNALGGQKSTVLEISISHEQQQVGKESLNMTVRDELKGLVQKAGIGASVALSDLSAADKPKVLSLLKYPKNSLDILWDDSNDLHTDAILLVSRLTTTFYL